MLGSQWRKRFTVLALTTLGASVMPFLSQGADLTTEDAIRFKWSGADDSVITDSSVHKTDSKGNLLYDFGNSTVKTNLKYDYRRTAAMGDPTVQNVTATINAGTIYLNNVSEGHDMETLGDTGLLISNGSHITLNSNLVIDKLNGRGGSVGGIITQNIGAYGEPDYDNGADSATTLVVNGDVTIRGSKGGTDASYGNTAYWGVSGDTQNGGHNSINTITDKAPAYLGNRWSPAGILLGRINGSSMTFNGNMDVAVKGNAVVADAHRFGNDDAYKNEINIEGKENGGSITIETPYLQKQYPVYSVASFGGTVNINMNKDRTAAGTNDVKITGNIISQKEDGKGMKDGEGKDNWTAITMPGRFRNGRLNIGLSTANSYLKGVIDNTGASQAGEINLWLQNGAEWDHQNGSVTAGVHRNGDHMNDSESMFYGIYDGTSHLTRLTGGTTKEQAGYIHQMETTPIDIENYSGNTVIMYDHAVKNKKEYEPTAFSGGAVTIHHADAGSTVTLLTDSKGFTSSVTDAANADLVKEALNNLAAKLIYSDYANGNLTGQVEIGDGLTKSAQILKTGRISWSTDSTGTKTAGQGYYNPAADPSLYANVPITGDFSDTADPSQKPYQDAGIVQKDGSYTFASDTTLKTKDYHSVIDAKDDVTVNAAGKVLTFKGTVDDKNNGSDVIHTSNGHAITINAKKVIVDAEQTAAGNHAWGMNIEGGNITVNGDMDITAKADGKDFRNTLGIRSQGSTVTINGTVTMRQDSGYAVDNPQASSNYRTGAVYATSAWGAGKNYGGTINIDKVDLKVNGNGLWSNIGASTVNVNGGTVETNPDNTVGFFALRAECGTVNMNVKRDSDGNVTGAGDNDVTVKGNVFADTGAINDIDKSIYTTINLGLTTGASSLTGIIWNGFEDEGNQNGNKTFYGRSNLWLANGAQWNNETYGTIDIDRLNYFGSDFAGSLLNNFHGGSDEAHTGYIYQKEDTPITLKNYEGYTTVFYAHDEKNPETMNGGDITVEKAAKGSGITLVTDSKGITAGFSSADKAADQNRVSEVLNKLAQKLFYTANDGNLAGKVKIAEGLTASSKSLKEGSISFSTDSTGTKTAGQGYYEYTPKEEVPSEFAVNITGDSTHDKAYSDAGIKADGVYTFSKDTSINLTPSSDDYAGIEYGNWNYSNDYDALVVNVKDGSTLSVNVKGTNPGYSLSRGVAGIDLETYGKRIQINGDTSFNVTNTDKAGKAYGIVVSNDSDNSIIGKGSMDITTSGAGLSHGIDFTSNKNSVRLDGKSGGHITIKTNADGADSLAVNAAKNKVSVNINYDQDTGAAVYDNETVKIDGDIYAVQTTRIGNASDDPLSNGTVNVGLTGKDSYLNGVIGYRADKTYKTEYGETYGTDFDPGTVNLVMTDGAVWKNGQYAKHTGKAWTQWAGSAVNTLKADGAYIYQNDSNPITVKNYGGNATVVYRHTVKEDSSRDNAAIYGNKAVSVSGGEFKVAKAEAGSSITLVTDREGLDTGSSTYTDRNLVNDALDKLANKLIYAGYADKNLTGKVSIAEGLTAASVTKSLAGGDISWYDGSKEGTAAGEGYYDYHLAYPDSQATDSYSEAITGDSSVDKGYVETGVLKDGTHDYSFTKPDTKITVGKTLIGGGPWLPPISAAVSGGGNGQGKSHEANLDLHGNSMTIETTTDTHTTGITAIGAGSVDVANAGKISVSAESTGGGQTAAIFVNGGGTVKIHNGGSNAADKVITLRAKGSNKYNVAVLKAMNGVRDAQSTVAIDGLVDILADGNDGSNEAVSAVASKVDIGGGNIKAVNGAVYAIRGYGEYQSSNKAIVNVNVKKDKDDHVTGAGTNDTAIEGDIFLGGGMDTSGARAEVNIGLNTKDSYFKGNIKKTNASSDGHVNLYMGNGASWIGNNLSGSTVTAHLNSDASWTGYSSGSAMNLDMNGTGLWNNAGASSLASISGNGGLINMSGDKAGTVSVKQYGGNTTLLYRHEIVADAARAHADLYGNKAASIIGGDFKITDAAADSAITLVTDSTGVSTTSTDYADKNLVNDLLDKLAGKLYYSGYANGTLKGYVRIAEGLTSSSITAKLRQEDISFYNADEAKTAGMAEGQGHYSYSLVYPDEQVKDPMATVIDGSKESKDAYRDAGIYKDKTDTYDFTKKPATVNTDGKSDSIIHAGDNNVNVKTNDVLNIIAKDGGIGMKAENGKTVTTTGNTNITAKDGTGILADKGTVKLANDTTIRTGTGMEAKNGGTITAEGKADITADGKALHADGDGSTITLNDGSISGKVLAENKGSITTNGAVLKGDVTAQTNGTAALTNGSTSAGITADGGTITTNGTEVVGEALAENSGTVAMTGGKAASVTADGGSASTDGTVVDGLISAKNGGTASMKNGSAKGLSADKDSTVTATLDKSDAKIDGNVANEGTASVNISNGAVWTGDSTGTGTTNANIGSGSIWTGASINGNTKAVIDGTWTQTGASKLASLSGSGTIDKRSDNNGDLNIASYSGSNTFVYNHSIVDDSTRENAEYYGDKNGGNKAVSVSGGNINIAEAAKGSTISLMTDRAGLNVDSSFFRDKNLTNDALDKLANKLYYHGTESLTGRVGFGEGLTAPSEWKNITFKKDGQGSYDYTTIVNSLDIQYGSEETAMMKGTKSALLGSAMMWRGNNNDIQRRMGDLRLGQGETGVWARYIGGKNRYDQQNTYLNQDYDIGQAGFDKKVGDWTVGLALDHGDGKAHYIGGKGKEKMNTLAVYGTRVSNDGRYFDVIVKTGQVKNKFDVSNEIGNKLHGDYKAWGNSISLEYGKRFVQDSGFYMDPSVEFTAGRLNGKNFKGTSDLGTLYVHQHGFNSAIGRIGFSIGRQQERSNIYAKFALAHEFGGSFRTDFYADDGGLKSTKVDLSDTWLDMELGGSLSLGKNVYLYGTYTRTFEADMATKWRADVGVRYTF